MTKPLLLAFAAGCIFMLCAWVAIADWRAMAAGWEEERCRDGSDTVAYFARKPGEGHSAEACVQVMRHGDPRWVPILNEPTIAGQGIRGKPGLQQQLVWIREECRKRAKQLKQRC